MTGRRRSRRFRPAYSSRDVSIGPWLQDDDLGLPRSQGGEGIELLVVDGPPGPQAGSLVLVCSASADGARPIGEVDPGVRVRQEVEPPGGLGTGPAVHGLGDEVGPILEVIRPYPKIA
jgi:hypothetical protein